MGPENPHGNAFTYTLNTLETEGGRLANNPALRTWHVTSGHRTNYTGASTQYQLIPQGYPVLMAQPESSVAKRAAFATQHLWVTKYEPNETFTVTLTGATGATLGATVTATGTWQFGMTMAWTEVASY